MKLKKFVEILINSRWRFSRPKRKNILVVDVEYNPFDQYFRSKDINIFYRRGEEINFYIVWECLKEFDLSYNNFYKKYIKHAKPKIIISGIDNNPGFYRLSKLTNTKTAFVQNGTKTYWNDIFGDKKINNKNNKKKFFVDYMFLFNKHIAKLYGSFISGKKILIGSFKNNIKNFNLKIKKKKEILFVSGCRTHHIYDKKILYNNPLDKNKIEFNHYNFYKNDGTLIKWLHDYSKNKNIKFNILGKSLDVKSEKTYFCKILNTSNINFIPFSKARNTYKILNNYEYVFSIDTTLGTENLVKGGKTGFFFNRPNFFPMNTRRFGGMEKLGMKGPFWTTSSNVKEFERVFKFVVNSNNKSWNKARNKFKNKVMLYDPGNKKFLEIVNSIIKEK